MMSGDGIARGAVFLACLFCALLGSILKAAGEPLICSPLLDTLHHVKARFPPLSPLLLQLHRAGLLWCERAAPSLLLAGESGDVSHPVGKTGGSGGGLWRDCLEIVRNLTLLNGDQGVGVGGPMVPAVFARAGSVDIQLGESSGEKMMVLSGLEGCLAWGHIWMRVYYRNTQVLGAFWVYP